MANDDDNIPVLELVDEKKIRKLLDKEEIGKKDLEASGVIFIAGFFYVVFDNRSQIARIQADLRSEKASVLGRKVKKVGYEGITFNGHDDIFYMVDESKLHDLEGHYAIVHEYDDKFDFLSKSRLNFRFSDGKKGFEGLSYIQREGSIHIFRIPN